MKAARQPYEQELLATIDGISAAVMHEISWGDAMERLCDFVGARAADLNVFDPVAMQQVAYHPARTDPFILRYISDYVTDIVNQNPRTKGIYFPMAEGRIVADSDIWRPEEMRVMPFFSDFLHPWGTWDSLHTWVRRTSDGRPWIALAIHFSEKGSPPQAETRRRVSVMMPHLRRACCLHEVLDTAQRHSSDLKETLDHMREPVALVSRTGRVTHANAAAHKVFSQLSGVYLSRDETLIFDQFSSHDALARALKECGQEPDAQRTQTASPTAQIVIERVNAAPVVLTVQALSAQRRARTSAVAMVFISAPAQADMDRLESLRTAYGLTPTELRVVKDLLAGKSLKQIAQGREVSYETARTHMRNILSKTGTRRQPALIAMLRDYR